MRKNYLTKCFAFIMAFMMAWSFVVPNGIVPESLTLNSSADAATVSGEPSFYGVLNANTALKLTSSSSSLVIKVYPKGTTLSVYSTNGDNYLVKISGQVGYVKKSAVTRDNATTTDYVNLRAGAGTNYSVLDTVPINTRVSIIGEKDGFYKVKVGDKTGFLSKDYVKRDPVGTAVTVNDTVASFNAKGYLYSSNTASSSVVKTCNIGTKVTLLAVSDEWCKVKVDTVTGYAKTSYLRRGNGYVKATVKLRNSASSSASSSKTLYAEERITIAKRGTEWTLVVAEGVKGYIPNKYAVEDRVYESSTEANTIYSVKTATKLLKAAGGTASIISLPVGTEVKYLSKSGSYYKVKVSGKEGFVKPEYLQTGNAVIIADETPIKNSPSAAAATIRTVNRGIRVSVISTANGWSKIMIGSVMGYIEQGFREKDYVGSYDFNPARNCFFASKDDVKLYKGASKTSGVIATLPKGKTGIAIGTSGSFKRVIVDGKAGYIYTADGYTAGNAYVSGKTAKILEKASPTSTALLTVSQTNKLTVIGEYGSWYYVKKDGKYGYILKPYVKKVTVGYTYTPNVEVKTVATANLVKEKSSTSTVIVKVPSGSTVTIFATGTQYSRVVYGNYIGYMLNDKIRATTSGKTDVVLDMFDSTGSERHKIAKLPAGAAVKIIKDYDNNWMQIQYGGKTGYVLSCYVTRTNKNEYIWKYVNGYKYAYDASGNRVRDVSDLVSGPYFIKTYKWQAITIVYAMDGSNGYTIPVKAMICSPGQPTITGTYYSPGSYRWLTMVGDVYAQWCTDILGSYLYHTVPVYTHTQFDLEVGEFNLLGELRSLGCVRLLSCDAKWIFDHTTSGQKIEITNANGSPVKKPERLPIASWHTWDPTDPTAYYKCRQYECH